MAAIRVGFIGTGKKKERPDLNGFFMAYRHAPAYQALPQCQLVACADIEKDHATAFANAFDVPAAYTNYHDMLASEKLDIVSICTWPHLHEEMVLACLEAGLPAVHSEKPMALTFGQCRTMLDAARNSPTQLTFNHQRRFGAPFRKTRELIGDGQIGRIVRMDALCGDLYDGGCHWVDLLNYFNGEARATWTLGQIDGREIRYAFGAPSEYQGLFQWGYDNGVLAVMLTGPDVREWGPPFRITGSEGIIEIGWDAASGPMLQVLRFTDGQWRDIDCAGESLHGPGFHERAIAYVLNCLASGQTPELCAENQMKSMEIVFGCYESCRRRGRVDLPMDIEDSPLLDMIETGALGSSR